MQDIFKYQYFLLAQGLLKFFGIKKISSTAQKFVQIVDYRHKMYAFDIIIIIILLLDDLSLTIGVSMAVGVSMTVHHNLTILNRRLGLFCSGRLLVSGTWLFDRLGRGRAGRGWLLAGSQPATGRTSAGCAGRKCTPAAQRCPCSCGGRFGSR